MITPGNSSPAEERDHDPEGRDREYRYDEGVEEFRMMDVRRNGAYYSRRNVQLHATASTGEGRDFRIVFREVHYVSLSSESNAFP